MPEKSRNRSASNKRGEIFIVSKDALALICATCGDDCYTLEAFGTHILQYHTPEEPITTCIKLEDSTICIKTEAAEQTNQRISRRHELNLIEKPYFTANKTKCGEIFQCLEDKFVLVCDKCGETFYALEDYGVHMLQDHPTTAGPIATDAVERPVIQSDSMRTDQVEVERPEIVFVKEEHDANKSDVSDPKPKYKKSFQCSFCDKLYKTNRDRDDHENMHYGRRPYECYMCQNAFAAFGSLQKHVRLLHSAERPYNCPICKQSFISKTKFHNHSREKHLPLTDPRRFFPCEYCDKLFKTYTNMSFHALKHKPIATGIFTCDYCRKDFPTRKKIVRHIGRHFAKSNYNCSFCDRRFSNSTSFRLHENHHRGIIAPLHQCKLCLKFYKYAPTLRRHVKVMHTHKKEPITRPTQKTKRPHQCKICKKVLASTYGLTLHKKTHTKEDGPPLRHSNNTSRRLNIDNRKHHLPKTDPQRYFSCTRCDSKFSTVTKLRLHEYRAHVGIFTCDYCQSEFMLRRSLVRHMLKHFPKTIYKCSVCDNKIFKTKYSRDQHENVHRGSSAIKYPCTLCPRTYIHKTSLLRHISRAHENKKLKTRNPTK